MCHGTFLRLLLTGNGSDISKLTFFQSQLTTKQKHLTGTGFKYSVDKSLRTNQFMWCKFRDV